MIWRAGSALLLCYGLILSSSNALAFDLTDALKMAENHDPGWRSAQSQWVGQKEAVPQARALLLPNLSVGASYMRNGQKIEDSQSNFADEGSFNSKQGSVNAKVPIWRKNLWTNLSKAEEDVQRARHELNAAHVDMFMRVVDAYLKVLKAQEDLKQNQSLVVAYEYEIARAQARFDHGATSIVDLRQVQAKHDEANANLIDAENNIAASQSELGEITGAEIQNIQPVRDGYEPLKAKQKTLQEWESLAWRSSPKYLAAVKGIDVAKKAVTAERDEHWPTLDLVGTYSRNDGQNAALMGQTASVTRQSQVGFEINIPVFSGGITSSKVRQAYAQLSQAQEQQDQVMSQIKTAVKRAYTGSTGGAAMISARRRAIESAQIALDAARKGLDRGMKTQIDVLLAQQQLALAKKEFVDTQLGVFANEMTLFALSGVLTEEYIEVINEDSIEKP